MLPAAVRIFVAAEAVDLRRGFDGLAGRHPEPDSARPLLCVGRPYVP